LKSPIEFRLLNAVQKLRLISPGDRVGVAVSGGADSVALLLLLQRLRSDLGIALSVVHFNHSLRGDESDGDARFVSDLAASLSLELIIAKEDVGAEAARQRKNVEDTARRLRYAFFQRVVDESRATRIAVAHTSDDQAETVLAHMIRGTGPTGLAGIYPRVGTVVRPLIEMRRQDLRQYLREIGQAWREDSTNQDAHRLRARIRAQLLPQLENDFSLQVVPHLSELARLSQEEALFWEALVEARFQSCVEARGESFAIQIRDLYALPGFAARATAVVPVPDDAPNAAWRPLTERLIRRLYQCVRGDRRDLSAEHVEQVIRLSTKSSSGHHIQLPGWINVEREFDTLIFSRASTARQSERIEETSSHQSAYHYVVALPDTGTAAVSVPELGTCFRLKMIDWPLVPRDTKRQAQALDADLLRSSVVLRSWRHGDAYRPCGRRNARKLKDMFLSRRVPAAERNSWPVLESCGVVVWTRGMAPAADFCATEQTRVGVVIEEDSI
jgi:tRNA(Ile)-lysidine synthase